MGTLLFRLCIYKLIWRKKNLNFKKQSSQELYIHTQKIPQDTLISLQFLFCRNPIPVALLFHIAEI